MTAKTALSANENTYPKPHPAGGMIELENGKEVLVIPSRPGVWINGIEHPLKRMIYDITNGTKTLHPSKDARQTGYGQTLR